MLENVSACQARIDDIKSHFKSGQVGGEVTIAPHYKADGALQPKSVQPFFPEYLIKPAQKAAASSGRGPSDYDDLISAAANKYGVDEALVKAVIRAESGFRANAMSHAGAQGLMQLMPSTAAGLGVSDPFDPAQNIEGGVKYLKGQIDRFGSVELALAAYNAGPGAVAKYGGVPPFKEPQGYVNRVLSYMQDYQQ